MLRSRARLALLVLLLAAVGWLAWRPSGGKRGRSERAEVPALPAEGAPAPAALAEPRLESAPAARVEAERIVDPTSPAVPTGGAATLSVRVVVQESGEPLAGIGVVLHEPQASWSTEPSTESRGGVGHLLTDAAGRVEFEVPSGVAFELRVNTLVAPVAGSARQDVAALAPGERRELVVELVTRLDLAWYGRIVDGADDAPLAGAAVERVLGDPFTDFTGQAAALSAADGLVRLAFASWSTGYARVELAGYATGFAHLDVGHEQPSSALPVRLARAAALEMRVTEPGGAPREGVDVRVSCKATDRMQNDPFTFTAYRFEAPTFEERTDAEGRCALEELPPEIALTLELFESGGLVRRESRPLVLEPGERRVLSCTIGGRCALAGRTLETDGSPAAGVTVWLLPDPGYGGLLREDEEPVAEVRSDAEGRFTLELAAGAWLVGPAPAQSGSHTAKRPQPDIAPKGEHVVIEAGQTSAEITLTCWRGLFLSGTVKGPDGQSKVSAYVGASGEDGYVGNSFTDGAFSLGPLTPGAYELNASATGSDTKWIADSMTRTVMAGTEGIELVLRRGAGVSVHVLDSQGMGPRDAKVWILPEAGSEGGFQLWSNDAAFALDTLLPGTYSISASSPAGEFALARGVTLTPGAEQELELHLVPASRLRISVLPRAEPSMTAEVRLEGCPIDSVDLSESASTVLAAGEYEVVLTSQAGTKPAELQRQRVRVTAEGETRVVFDLAAPR